jgi:peptide/nickel transport system permease protein
MSQVGMGVEEQRASRGRPSANKIGLWVGGTIIGLFVVVAVLAPVFAPDDPLKVDVAGTLLPPSGSHWLGTDALGRDFLSRLIFAARFDIVVAVAATGMGLVIGTMIGLLSGYFRAVDVVVGRLVDILLAVPSYALIITMLLVFGTGGLSVVVVLALTGWIGYARLCRSQVLVIRNQDYIASARLGGLGSAQVLVRHVLPNVWRQLILLWASDIVVVISAIAALGYLGIGVQSPTPEWGALVQEGQQFLLTNWWLSVVPGATIAVFGIGLALVSDSIAQGRSQR